MSDFSAERLNELLQVAEKRPLTPTEQAILQELLSQRNARQAASAHQHLQSHYVPAGQSRAWSPDELAQISATIRQTTARKTRHKRLQKNVTQLAWAAALIALLLGGIVIAPLFFEPTIEPAAVQLPVATATATTTPTPTPTPTLPPTATPQPTPTLPPNYVYATLLTDNAQRFGVYPEGLYQQTIAEINTQWGNDLYLPLQLIQSWTFAGALMDETNNVFEIAFVQEIGNDRSTWILSQSPASGRNVTPPLPVIYQPLPRIDETNIYDDKTINVGELSGYAYQYEYVYREGDVLTWVVYNTVTWQQDEQLFTLTLATDDLYPTTLIASVAENLRLELIKTEQ